MANLILLPPSEGKNAGGKGIWKPSSGRFKQLGDRRSIVVDALRGAMADPVRAAGLLGVKGVALAEAQQFNTALLHTPSLPAHLRYSGVVWSHLDASSLSTTATDRADEEVVVVSALLGLVAWNDPVPQYKLKVSARLPGLPAFVPYWNDAIGTALLKKHKQATIVNLLPLDYARLVPFSSFPKATLIDVRFIDQDRRAVGHFAKAAKGLLAAHMLELGDPLEAATTFGADGWVGAVERVSDKHFVATIRKHP